jgi:hypothetical protein
LRDLLLTLAALDAFDVAWTDEILEEVRRNVIADNPDIDPVRFTEHTLGAMRSAFPDATVANYQSIVSQMDNHPKDRHVAAAAISAGATAIVTINVRDFRGNVLSEAGIKIITPGDLVESLLDEEPSIVVTAIEHLCRRWNNPNRSVSEILDLIERHPTMSNAVGRLRDQVS